MAQKHIKTHPFHIIEPSPWPFIGALAAFCLTLGAVLFMHGHGAWVLSVGALLLALTMGGWWRDVIRESKTEHTLPIRQGLRYGMILFILSEVMFFVAFFWGYFDASIFPADSIGNIWPPKNIKTLNPFDLPYLNTLLLLLSGTTITWAHHSLLEGDIKDMILKTGFTILLGLTFLGVQVYEYTHAGFSFRGGIYPSVFYMTTGFHGFHVFVGVCFLTVCFFRARVGHFKPDDHFGFEAAAWYWHFVDVVWLFLFICLYWWGS